ncbi:hypothetical protein OWR21_11580 [Ralstonia sp. 1B3]
MKKEFAMRLKQMGLAAMLAVGALAAGSAWAQASRVEVFGQNARAERFDVYSDGARTGRFDTYTEGRAAAASIRIRTACAATLPAAPARVAARSTGIRFRIDALNGIHRVRHAAVTH